VDVKIDYRLALDLGTNSIGWCVYRLERDDAGTDERERWRPISVQRLGVRIFSDGRNPKDLASLAVARRLARQQRRRRDRALKRKTRLLKALVEIGLLPDDPLKRKALVSLDPYPLRARALTDAMDPHHVGRALFHLARKRGFRSGRKDLAPDDKEAGKIKTGIKNLKAQIAQANCATVGALLAERHQRTEPVLARPDAAGDYPIYLARELIAEEFDAIWAAQARHSPAVFTPEAASRLRDIILHQRRLRPVEPGRCFFELGEHRALLAHPMSQRFRILQELANLRIQYAPFDIRPLSREQRDKVLQVLSDGGSSLSAGGSLLTWAELRKLVGAPKGAPINLDTSGRKGLKADTVSIGLAAPEALGRDWRSWDPATQDRFLRALRRVDRVEELEPALQAAGFNLPNATLAAVFGLAARMPDDFGRLSLVALARIVPKLEADVIHYDEAARRAGYRSHSDRYDGELAPNLPYYGQRLPGYVQPRDVPGASPDERAHGRIANPTVHVGLNQLRRVVNAIIKRYGHPREIIIEVARELGLSGEHRRELDREQRKNRERNDRYADELARLGQRNNRENRQRLQLFEEIEGKDPLGAECVYTGMRISRAKLFSDEIEIDHILPFSRSLDDGIGNKVLCVRRANRDKQQRTPHEAFGHSPGSYDWQAILERVGRLLPPRKRTRFQPQALEEFLRDRDFLDRHLTDTAYFSRVAREYLTAICPPNCIWVSTGKLTAMMRAKLGLNRILSTSGTKERTDHRHHAVDAAVIGVCDRRLIRAMATAAARAERDGERRLLEGIAPPWPGFFEEVRDSVMNIAVSHKPDHGVEGSLHKQTNYGIKGDQDARGAWLVSSRVPVTSLKAMHCDDHASERIVDSRLRSELRELFRANSSEAASRRALESFVDGSGQRVRRVQLERRSSGILIDSRKGDGPYRLVEGGSNHCLDIFRDDHGGWGALLTSTYEANRPAAKTRLRDKRPATALNGRPLLMRLRKGDYLMIEPESGKRVLMLVQECRSALDVGLVDPRFNDSNSKHEDRSRRPVFRGAASLRSLRARQVWVDELGYVNDPGFRE
jgi:CRISPR-associated endonuclease Csn1